MFGGRVKLFSLLGFEVKVDASWVILALLVTWSLAQGLFPVYFQGMSRGAYWLMGLAGAAGLFLSIIFHELSHSLVAKRYGIPMKGITLFIFGGVAEMSDEPRDARSEFLMALSGPVSSIVIAVVLYGIYSIAAGWPEPVRAVIIYLAWINLILAIFNLIPAFPLDGGRVLRSILWRWKNNLSWATKKAAGMGSLFGMLLLLLGVFAIFQGDFIGGIWWFLIGLFLRNAASMSCQNLLARNALAGEKVSRFMVTDPVTVPPSLSIGELVDHYIYKYQFKMFPVVAADSPVGCVTLGQVRHIPREEWNSRTVGEITNHTSVENTIGPDADAIEALTIMNRSGNSRLMVVDKDRLIGIISLKDLLRFLSLKLDLGASQ